MKSSARSTYTSSTKDPLQRRVKKNPKYEHVERVVDSGMNIHKVQTITTREYLKRKGELFKRVKPTTLYALMIDHDDSRGESIYDIGTVPEDGPAGDTAGGAGGGAGAAIAVVTHSAADAGSQKPYLILDVRDADDYAQCKLTEAVNYPSSMLSQDRITPLLFSYKNKKDHMIIVYGNEEKLAASTATMFVQKGWENVFMLSGGLKIVAQKFPLLVEGKVPDSLKASPKKGGRSRGSVISSRASVTTAGGGGGRSPKTMATARLFSDRASVKSWR